MTSTSLLLRARLGRSRVVRVVAGAAVALAAAGLSGCATGPANDPFENYNRGTTDFNESLDAMVLKPVAETYRDVTPVLVRTGVSNFFGNLGDMLSFVNHVLQLQMEPALNSLVRFNVNTLFGLGGVLDIASEMGVDRYKQDLGQTLGYWGVPTGPYLVLPLMGPSTVRDALVIPLGTSTAVLRTVSPVATRNSLYVLNAVNTRSNLLRASSVLDGAALDKYSFMRDAYMSLRAQGNGWRNDASTGADSDASGANGASDGVLPNEPY